MAKSPKHNGPKGRAKPHRDYRAEYTRRVALAEARGESRSKGRGHARAGERPKPSQPRLISPVQGEERAVKLIKHGSTVRAAAKAVGVSEERVRRYLKENTNAKREGRQWIIRDERARQFPLYSEGRLISPRLAPTETSKAARFMHAVKAFLPSGNEEILAPFVGDGVNDLKGRRLAFETDPNRLYELDAADEPNFPELYKIVSEAL
jgi:hypothetical protein